MTTVMVRARPETRAKLRELSQREGVSAVEMLDRLVTEHEDARLLAAFATMTPVEVEASREEAAAWDAAAADGLDPSEDFSWVGSDEAST